MLRLKPAYSMRLPCYEIRLPPKETSEEDVLYMRFETAKDEDAIETFNFSRKNHTHVKKYGKLYKLEATQIA